MNRSTLGITGDESRVGNFIRTLSTIATIPCYLSLWVKQFYFCLWSIQSWNCWTRSPNIREELLQTPLTQAQLMQKQEDFYSVMTGPFRFGIWRTSIAVTVHLLKRKATDTKGEPVGCFPTYWIGLFKGLLAVIGLFQGRRIAAWSGDKGEHLWSILTLVQWLNQYIRNWVNICGLSLPQFPEWSYVWRLFTRTQEDEQSSMCVWRLSHFQERVSVRF